MTIRSDRGGGAVQACRPYVMQNVSYTATAALSAFFASTTTPGGFTPAGIVTPQNTTHIRLVSSTNCWVAIGPAPVATVGGATCFYLPGNAPEYFWVVPGERVSVIQDTAAGTLNVGELAN